MRSKPGQPKLEKFRAEVSDLGAEACLPSALSMEWLTELLQSTEAMLEGPDRGAAGSLAIAAVLTILDATGRTAQFVDTTDASRIELIGAYRIELALEMMHRLTDVKYEAATLQDIFTNRDVVTWQTPNMLGKI